MYCEYWNLHKAPFDNVPDSSMYVDCHVSMENVISETIFAIKEGNECLAVIVGEVGLGKTLSLRIIIDSLEPEKYKVALITNPALSFIQLLREIIGQITGKQCEEKKKVDLLEIFNHLLFETKDQGKKIVVVIDESNVLSGANLENLRLLTNMQDDEHNLFTLILAGQIEFAQMLEHPKRANIFQRIGTYGHIEKLPSEEDVKTYVESRLKIAGTQEKIFSDEAFNIIWDYSEHGIPRLINKICKLCLKAGETNEFKTISAEVVTQIADRFQKISKVTSQNHKTDHKKPHSIPDVELEEDDDSDEQEEETVQQMPKTSARGKWHPTAHIPHQAPSRETDALETKAVPPVQEAPISIPPPLPPIREVIPEIKAVPPVQEAPISIPPPLPPIREVITETKAVPPVQEAPISIPPPLPPIREVIPEIKAVPPKRVSANYVPLPRGNMSAEIKAVPKVPSPTPISAQRQNPVEIMQPEKEVYEEILIGKYKVKLSIPANIIRQAKLAGSESKNKLAGYWSAQIIKENTHLMHSSMIDPVAVWYEIKNIILKKFDSVSNTNVAMTS